MPFGVNQTATINAVVAGTDGLTKLGYGGLTLTAANTLTGGINVRAGALNLDWNDEIVQGSGLTRDGQIVHPSLKAAAE